MKIAPLADVKALLAQSQESNQSGQGLTADEFWRTVKQRTAKFSKAKPVAD